jgi:hypothetical protein
MTHTSLRITFDDATPSGMVGALAGAAASLQLHWPVVREDGIQILLSIRGALTAVERGVATIRIDRSHFLAS